jgi:nucleotide-binding universal stress UspA family protein
MFRRMLLVVDDFEAGTAAVTFAADIAQQFDASVWILGVEEHSTRRKGMLNRYTASPVTPEGHADTDLQRVGVSVSGVTRMDRTHQLADAIAREAAHFEADLIVLGLDRPRIAHRHFSKGIQEQLARVSTLPVMIAPSPAGNARPLRLVGQALQPQ